MLIIKDITDIYDFVVEINNQRRHIHRRENEVDMCNAVTFRMLGLDVKLIVDEYAVDMDNVTTLKALEKIVRRKLKKGGNDFQPDRFHLEFFMCEDGSIIRNIRTLKKCKELFVRIARNKLEVEIDTEENLPSDVDPYVFYIQNHWEYTRFDIDFMDEIYEIYEITMESPLYMSEHAKNCIQLVGCSKIQSIGDDVFRENKYITTLDLPNVKMIGRYAFYECTYLESLDLPVVNTIGEYAFYNCTYLESLDLPVVNTIGEYAFYQCTDLESLNLPDVSTIGEYAFYACDGLKGTLSLPNVNTIGDNAFSSCYGLKGTLSLPNAKTIGVGAFCSCYGLKGTLSLPNAKTIGAGAFCSCYGLKGTLSLPNAKTIGAGAFEGCTRLVTVYLNSVTEIGDNAFAYCGQGLKTVFISETLYDLILDKRAYKIKIFQTDMVCLAKYKPPGN